jgi:hypothetical protein
MSMLQIWSMRRHNNCKPICRNFSLIGVYIIWVLPTRETCSLWLWGPKEASYKRSSSNTLCCNWEIVWVGATTKAEPGWDTVGLLYSLHTSPIITHWDTVWVSTARCMRSEQLMKTQYQFHLSHIIHIPRCKARQTNTEQCSHIGQVSVPMVSGVMKAVISK